MLSIRLVGLVELQARLDHMPVTLQDKLRIFMARFTILLRDRVKANITERFKVVTGEFPESVQSQQIETPGSVTGRVFIDTLPWAAIQERGGRTLPHVIEPVTAGALAFLMPARMGFAGGPKGSALMFAQKVNHPGSSIPERSYMRFALVQMRSPFEGGIREVVNESIAENFTGATV